MLKFEKKLNYYSIAELSILVTLCTVAVAISWFAPVKGELLFKFWVAIITLPFAILALILRLINFKKQAELVEVTETEVLYGGQRIALEDLTEFSLVRKGDFYQVYISQGSRQLLNSKKEYLLLSEQGELTKHPKLAQIGNTYYYK